MGQNMLSIEERREILTDQVKDQEARGAYQYVVVSGGGWSAQGLIGRIGHAQGGDLDAIATQLNRNEDDAIRGKRRDDVDQLRDEERNRPLYDPDAPEVIEARLQMEEANERAAEEHLPATRKQIAELIGLQRDILDELRSRARSDQ